MDTPSPITSSEDLQRLLERFHRAGWITGMNAASPKAFQMDFTLLGHGRMRQLFEVLQGEIKPNSSTDRELGPSETEKVLIEQLLQGMAELYPPFLSQGEKETLMRLALAYAERRA